MLRYQLNPHFMFNTPNALNSLIVQREGQKAEQLMDFARANQAVKVAAMLQPYEDRIKGRVIIQDIAAAPAN